MTNEERIGIYVAALERIRSSPPPDVKSWADRYSWCAIQAKDALEQAPPEQLRTGSGTLNGKRIPYVTCLDCGWLTYGGGSADHTDDCIHSRRRSIRGHVASGFGARALAETIEKGDSIDIPSLGVKLTKKDLI